MEACAKTSYSELYLQKPLTDGNNLANVPYSRLILRGENFADFALSSKF